MQELDKKILDLYQRDFPITPAPFAEIARHLGASEAEVLESCRRLQAQRKINRIGAIIENSLVGVSTLAALSVPEDRLEDVAALVSAYPGVNHNYERENHYNLWFVASAADRPALNALLREIEERTQLEVLDLPMLEGYHLDLGFTLQWN